MKRSWLETTSGKVLADIRKREELSRRDAAKRLSLLMHRDVTTHDLEAWEDGLQPSQVALSALMQAYNMDSEDYGELFPPTSAEDERRNERAERKLAVEKRQQAVDESGWAPVRLRGDRFAEQLDEEPESAADPRRLPGGAQ